MIILKILLWIILAVFGIIFLILLLPVRAEVSYIDKKLTYKVKYSLLLLYNSDKKGLIPWYLKWRKEKEAQNPEEDDSPVVDEISDTPDISADDVPDLEKEDTEETVTEVSETPAEIPEEEKKTEETTENITAEEEISEEDDKKDKKSDKKEDKPKREKDILEKLDIVLDMWRAADRPVLKILKGVKFHELYIDFIVANEDAFTCAMEYGSISGTIYNVLGWMGVLFNVKLKTIDIVPGFALKESRWDAAGKLCVRPITAVIAGIQFLITYSIRYFIPYKLQERKLNKHAARQK